LLSVCDHGTIASYERLAAACKQNGISYVLGIEMGASMHGDTHDILVYSFDKANEKMRELVRRQNAISEKECEAMIVKMSGDYPQVSLTGYRSYEVPRDAGGWKYLHYAAAKGICKTYAEANQVIFAKYYEAGEETLPVEEYCGTAKQAGGVPVLAHPGNMPPERLVSLFRDMQERGVEGVECFYPSHSKATIEACLYYCRRNNLRITCGCDCHGAYDRSPGFTIGSLKIPRDMLDLRGIS